MKIAVETWRCLLCGSKFNTVNKTGGLDIDVFTWGLRCPHDLEYVGHRMLYNKQRFPMSIVKYADMAEIQSEKTGEIKVVSAALAEKLKKPDGVKTGEVSEWSVINEESGCVRTDGSDRQEAV